MAQAHGIAERTRSQTRGSPAGLSRPDRGGGQGTRSGRHDATRQAEGRRPHRLRPRGCRRRPRRAVGSSSGWSGGPQFLPRANGARSAKLS